VAKGGDFKATAEKMNLKVETLPAFIPAKVAQDPKTAARLNAIAEASFRLAPGQVSDPVPVEADNTVLILHLDARAKADPAGLADFENTFRQSQDEQLQEQVYVDWANWMSNRPGTRKPPDLDLYGGLE
jgi:hypothetical protein